MKKYKFYLIKNQQDLKNILEKKVCKMVFIYTHFMKYFRFLSEKMFKLCISWDINLAGSGKYFIKKIFLQKSLYSDYFIKF